MSKFFYNRATTRICVKKPFIVMSEKFSQSIKNVNKRPYWLVKNTPHFIVWFDREDLPVSRFLANNCVWKAQIYGENGENQSQTNWSGTKNCFKSQRPSLPADKFAKRATCEFFSALFLLLVGSGPKRSMPIEKLGSFLLVSSIFQREGKLHCVKR